MNRIGFLRKSVFGLGMIPTLPFWIKSLFSKPTYTLQMFHHDLHKPGGVLNLFPDVDTPLTKFIAAHGVKTPAGDPEIRMFEHRAGWTEIKSIPIREPHNID